MLTHALYAATLGFPVFPVHGLFQATSGEIRCTCGAPTCSGRNRGKHPATARGLLDGTRDPNVITSWWGQQPLRNVAGRTGEVVVLDVDADKGGDQSLRCLEAQNGALPKTCVSVTGTGWHVFFSQREGPAIGCSTGRLGPGLDVKGVGGYVVLPGSRHYSGRTYAWHRDHHPDKTPLAPVPKWLADLFQSMKGSSSSARPQGHWAQLVNESVGEGVRNSTLTHITGHLLWSGKVSPHVALEFARLWNRAHCTPPLSDDEVVRVVDSISGRELQKRGVLR